MFTTLLSKTAMRVSRPDRFGAPPKTIRLTDGNILNANLKFILSKNLQIAIELLGKGEEIVKIGWVFNFKF